MDPSLKKFKITNHLSLFRGKLVLVDLQIHLWLFKSSIESDFKSLRLTDLG